MPIYEYECKDCKWIFEEIRSIGSADLPFMCENCKSDRTGRKLSNFFSKGSTSKGNSNGSSCGSCAGGNCSSCH